MRARLLLGLVGAAAALLLVDDALVDAAELTEIAMLATRDEVVAGVDVCVLLCDAEARVEADTELDSVAAGFSAEASVVGPASLDVVGIGVRVYELVMEAAVVMAVELEPSAGGRTMTQRASAPARSRAPRTEDETRMLSIRLG